MKRVISRRALGLGMAALFFLSLIPLIAIAVYNYPADDDFEFVLPLSTAWVQTGSLWEVLKALAQKTWEKYQTWQGDFVSTALFGVTPMIFGVKWYFLDNWLMLALVCLSAGYLVRAAVCRCLNADRWTFWIVYGAVMILLLQFMPSISYSIYWHNGGQYTTAACMLMLAVGLLLRSSLQPSAWHTACAGLIGFCLGGSFFGPALGALVLIALWCATAFVRKDKCRTAAALMLGLGLCSFLPSVLAPGNALRQERTGERMSVLATLITAVLDSFDLAGQWLTPQLAAMLMLILPVLWKPLKESRYAFSAPLWVWVMLYGLFSASLAPGLYTGYGWNTARYENAIYFYFILMALGSAVYAEGALIRWLERHEAAKPYAGHVLAAAHTLGARFSAVYLALVIALTALGGFGQTIMNTSSVSAARSLATGEARQFRTEMAQRQEYIRVTDSDTVAVQPLSVQPYVFKNDRLPWQGIYGRVRYMKWYFELFDGAAE